MKSIQRNLQESGLLPYSADIKNVIFDMNRSFNPLHKEFMLDYHVSDVRNGYVFLTIALPEGMTKVFGSMLESLSLFFRFMDYKVKQSRLKSYVRC
jgi:hypothetical protein